LTLIVGFSMGRSVWSFQLTGEAVLQSTPQG
jgi:hypothetical protein